MIRISIISLSFSPKLTKIREFFVQFQILNSTQYNTFPQKYNMQSNLIMFGESFEIYDQDLNNNCYITLVIHEKNNFNNKQIIAKKVEQFDFKFIQDISVNKKEIKFQKTSIESCIFLKMQIESQNSFVLKEIFEQGDNEKQKELIKFSFKDINSDKIKDYFNNIKLEANNFYQQVYKNSNGLEIIKANELMAKFVLKLTYFVKIKQFFLNIYQWKQPEKTLYFGIFVTLLLKSSEGLLIFLLLIFYMKSHFFIQHFIKQFEIKNCAFHHKIQNDIIDLEQNVILIQQIQKITIFIDEIITQTLYNEDKTQMIEWLFFLRKYVVIFIFSLLIIKTINFLLVIFWLSLIYCHPSYGFIIIFIFKQLDKILDNIEQKINKFTKLLTNQVKDSFIKQEFSNVQNQRIKKTFLVYENQRYWVGSGWTNSLLPIIERPKWSDIDGQIELVKENIQLPGNDWYWISDWAVDINENTDSEGWTYALNFMSNFHKKNEYLDNVRRRKWIRTCKESIINQDQAYQSPKKQFDLSKDN